jgi:hypothetical protein
MRVVAVAAVVVLALGVLWVGGEMHRHNCIDAGRVGCSLLPWDNGSERPARHHGPVQHVIPLS